MRHRGPGGPHPREKIPEGKVETDFVYLGAFGVKQMELLS
jgi:hypothetical protein